MINNVNAPKIPQILSDKAHELYRKFRAFLMKVYSMIKYRIKLPRLCRSRGFPKGDPLV